MKAQTINLREKGTIDKGVDKKRHLNKIFKKKIPKWFQYKFNVIILETSKYFSCHQSKWNPS